MTTRTRLRGPLFVLSGVVLAVVTFAGPANAADPVYPPPPGTTVLGVTASTGTPVQAVEAAPVVEVAGVTQSAGTLAFTGANALGLGALGGLLLVGGTTLVLTGRRRKNNA